MTSSFSNLSLAEPLARAVAEMGYETMTPIQEQAIPVVLPGQDVMGAAQTGTGKTAAFSLPLLQRMLKHENTSTSPARHPVRALVLLPTRELADQVAQQVKLYAKYTNLRSAVVFGGMDMKPQTLELKKGVEVLVATPGRLLDHIEAKNAVLNQVEYVVLDEADRMLDIGFLPDLQRILSYLPKQRTTLLFSATFSPEIKRLASSYLQNPVTIEVARPNDTASTVEQHFYSVGDDDKRRALQADRAPARHDAGLRLRQQQARLRAAGAFAGARGPEDHRPARRQEPGRAPEGAGRLQGRRGRPAGGHRRGRARPGHQGRAGGVQLRHPVQRRGLRAPHRPHRPRRRLGPGGELRGGGNDARLVADIEKLIKTKIELEPIEFEEDRPRGRINDGRRALARRGRGRRRARRARRAARAARDAAPRSASRPARRPSAPRAGAPRDPFFDKPYEAPAARGRAGLGSRGQAARRRAASRPTSSRKRKVAALFKSVEPAAVRLAASD